MDAKIDHFSELSKFLGDKSLVCADFLSLLGRFKLGHSLSRLKMEKEKGARSILLLQYLLIFRLCGQSIHQSLHQQFGELIGGGKNQFYRFLTRPRMDWRRLLLATAKSFFRIVREESSDAEQERYFILDDTTLEKTGLCMEGISRVFDHVVQKCVLGYKLLMLTCSRRPLPILRPEWTSNASSDIIKISKIVPRFTLFKQKKHKCLWTQVQHTKFRSRNPTSAASEGVGNSANNIDYA